MDAILTYDLCKQYKTGNRAAVHMLNLQVPAGQIFALVGPAGCGKSTALRLFAGLTSPTSGECTVLGYSPQYEQQKLNAQIGVATDGARLYDNMTLQENLRFFSKLNGLDSYDAVDRISFLLHKLDIWEMRDKVVRDIPTSAKQRSNYARALLHSPRLVLLDEPTEGMDKETTELVKALVDYMVEEEDATVVVSTRHLDHAQAICNQFAILQDGVLHAKGNLETLRKRTGLTYRAEFHISEKSPVPQGFLFQGNGCYLCHIRTEEEMPVLLKELTAFGCNIYEAKIVKPSLSDIYEKMQMGYDEEGEIYEDDQNQEDGDRPAGSPEARPQQPESEADFAGELAAGSPADSEQPEYFREPEHHTEPQWWPAAGGVVEASDFIADSSGADADYT